MSNSLSAICVGCTAKKRIEASSFLSQNSLSIGDQRAVSNEWNERLRRPSPSALVPAASMYAGRSVVRGRELSDALSAPLFIFSAGLGLLRADTPVPSYDLTIAKASGAVTEKISDEFSPHAWWRSVLKGPYAVARSCVMRGEGRIVVGLSQGYAAMVGPWLSAWPSESRARLRLMGAGLDRLLPPSLLPQWIRYDRRLDVVMPGLQLHYAIRAMDHFLSVCGTAPMADAASDQEMIDLAIDRIAVPVATRRERLSDDALRTVAVSAMSRFGSIARALAHVRIVEGVACSDQRFRELLREANP